MSLLASRRLILQSISIAVGTIFCFIALDLFFYRLLAERPMRVFFLMVGGIGVITAIIGVVEANGHPPGERGFGATLVVEGVLLFLLTLAAWVFGAPTPIPPLQ